MLTRTFLLTWYTAMMSRIDKAGHFVQKKMPKQNSILDVVAPPSVKGVELELSTILTEDWTHTPIVSEETYTAEQGKSKLVTWIDPLDATQEYSEGLNRYVSIMACLTENGQPQAAIMHFPFRNETWAVIGNEWLERPAMEFSPPQNIIVSRSHRGKVEQVFDGFAITRAGGSGYKSAEVMKGNNLAYVHTTKIKTWDICAPDAFLRASNGTFVEWTTGKPFNYTKTYHTNGLFASTTTTRNWFRMTLILKKPVIRLVIAFLVWLAIYLYPQNKLEKPTKTDSRKLSFVLCAIGLVCAFVVWGIAQERIMSIEYEGKRFEHPTVIIFISRLTAATLSEYFVKKQSTPLFKFSIASFTNVVSSICQYTALQYTIFPIVVIFKSLKVIPVLLVGKFVFKKKYKPIAYGLALCLSTGVAICLFSRFNEYSNTLSVFGLFLLSGYVFADALTSQWQAYLYKEYETPPFEMMWGVNTCSLLFTGIYTLITGEIDATIEFGIQHPSFVVHVACLCIPAVIGQLFIFKTIQSHGAASFAMIMTARQAISLIASCIIFGHKFDMIGILGFVIVIGTLFIKSRVILEVRDEYEKVSLEEDIENLAVENHKD
jgi:adenosine 3'-phospho 5'-phosphosulfate transporter B2